MRNEEFTNGGFTDKCDKEIKPLLKPMESMLPRERIHHCVACHNEKHGVKTRRAVPHTCIKGMSINDNKLKDDDPYNFRDQIKY